MDEAPAPLVLDLVEWIARAPRPYLEAMEAWRTSCPRLPVWETATDRGLIARRREDEAGFCVVATEAGRDFLRAHGRVPA